MPKNFICSNCLMQYDELRDFCPECWTYTSIVDFRQYEESKKRYGDKMDDKLATCWFCQSCQSWVRVRNRVNHFIAVHEYQREEI